MTYDQLIKLRKTEISKFTTLAELEATKETRKAFLKNENGNKISEHYISQTYQFIYENLIDAGFTIFDINHADITIYNNDIVININVTATQVGENYKENESFEIWTFTGLKLIQSENSEPYFEFAKKKPLLNLHKKFISETINKHL